MAGEFNHIAKQLTNLNSDKNPNLWDERTKDRAPHKPFLLLSMLDGIEQGWIESNQVELSQSLIEHFFRYWDWIMGEDRATTIALPFFHMKSESFWEIRYKPGMEEFGYSPSLGTLKDRIEFAVMEESLFDLMNDSQVRQQTRSLLLETYFGELTAVEVEKAGSFNRTAFDYSGHLESLVAEPFVPYHPKNDQEKYREGKIQMREEGFSKVVKDRYNYTCAICRDRVITPGGKSLAEGAHIIPWSESNNDDPRNGLSLCRSHHWMFDAYMLTIDTNYSIRLSKWLKKQNNEVGDLWKWNKERILLPEVKSFIPSPEALEDHYRRFEEFDGKW